MVLSARDMGIREGLNPVFCGICGNRICWASEDSDTEDTLFECEDCARREVE